MRGKPSTPLKGQQPAVLWIPSLLSFHAFKRCLHVSHAHLKVYIQQMFTELIRNYGFTAVAADLYEIQRMYLKHKINSHTPPCWHLRGRGHESPCALKPRARSPVSDKGKFWRGRRGDVWRLNLPAAPSHSSVLPAAFPLGGRGRLPHTFLEADFAEVS